MQSGILARFESACPMRFFQLTSEARLAVGDPGECEEAILKLMRQKGTVLQVLDRLALRVQQLLYYPDDFIAMEQEELEKFNMRVERLCGFAHQTQSVDGLHPEGVKEGSRVWSATRDTPGSRVS